MRRSRLKIFAVVLAVLALACWWAWQNRDRIAPGLVNPLLEGSQVESIRGLDLGFRSMNLEQITLTLESGSKVALRDIRLQQPLDLLFGAAENHSRLTIAELGYLPAPQIAPAGTPTTPPGDEETIEETPQAAGEGPLAKEPVAGDLRLGELLRLLQRYLPEHIEIEDLRWLGGPIERGRLTLARDHSTDSVDLRLSSEQRQLHLWLRNPDRQLDIRMALLTGKERAATLSGTLKRLDTEQWRARLGLQLALEQLRRLPLPASVQEATDTATGAIKGELDTQFPDRLLRLGEYRDTTLQLSADDAALTLPASLLGAPLQLAFATPEATSIAFASLSPFRPRDISGSSRLVVTPASSDMPLLSADIDTGVSRGQPVISLAGDVRFEALEPLLQAERWRSLTGKIKLSLPEGGGSFRGTAKLAPLERIASGSAPTVRDLEFTLLPRSRLGIAISAGDGGAPAVRPGWQAGTATVKLAQALTLSAAQWPGAVALRAPALELIAQADSDGPPISARAADVVCRIDSEHTCTLGVDMEADRLALPPQEMTGEEISFRSRLEIGVRKQELRAKLLDTEIAAATLQQREWRLRDLSLQSPALECSLLATQVDCSAASLAISTGSAGTEGIEASGTLELEAVSAANPGGELRARAQYRSGDIGVLVQDRYALDTSIDGRFELVGDRLRGSGRFRAGALRADADWRHQLDSGRGSADFEVPAIEFSRNAPLSDSISGLPVDLVAGSIAASGRISWPLADGSDDDSLSLTLDRIAGVYGDMFAVDVSGTLSARRRQGLWVTEAPQPMAVGSVDVGVAIDDIRFALSLDRQRDLELTGLSAGLLGGRLQSPALTWNLDGEARHSEVRLDGISLEQLAGEMEAENFAASGILDLRIPLLTDKDGVTVEQGRVEARPPGGRLRYYGAFSPDMLSGNPQLKLIAGALEDYNYRELSGTLEYPPSGDMQMQLRLVGRSDSVAEDRDLVINLNLENNIPDMLRSLQASRDLTGALEEAVGDQ